MPRENNVRRSLASASAVGCASPFIKCNPCNNIGHISTACLKGKTARSAQSQQSASPAESADLIHCGISSEASSYQLPMLAQSQQSIGCTSLRSCQNAGAGHSRHSYYLHACLTPTYKWPNTGHFWTLWTPTTDNLSTTSRTTQTSLHITSSSMPIKIFLVSTIN